MKEFLQYELSEKLDNAKRISRFNKRELEGYEITILKYKSKLHNIDENEINNFCQLIFQEEEQQKKHLYYWADFQRGKGNAVIDIATVLRQTFR